VALLLEKPEPSGSERNRGRKRLWTLLPQPRLPLRGFEGLDVLHHVNGALAYPLFRALRDTLLWADVATAERKGLFRGDLALVADGNDTSDPSLTVALTTFTAIASAPDEVDPSSVSAACLSVAQWAARQGLPEVELTFSVAAARAQSQNPDLACIAGRIARELDLFDLSREWFSYGLGIARRTGNETAYATACLGRAITEEKAGRGRGARRWFVRAWRAAKRGKLRTLAAAARHNMIALSLADGNLAEGQRHIISAYKLYGRRSPLLFRLANDAAGLWSIFGFYSIALPLYEAALPHVNVWSERAAILANICQAAGILGQRDKFLESWDAAQIEYRPGAVSPAACVQIVRGAQNLGYDALAKNLLRIVLDAYAKSGHPGKSKQVDSLLAESDRPAAEPPPEISRFAIRFLERLNDLSASA
jgi:hypothetical protein